MSPREVYRELEAARGRQQDAADARLHAAWQTAAFAALAMVGKLPPLAAILKPTETTRKPIAALQTKHEMATTVRMLADYYGQPIRKTAN